MQTSLSPFSLHAPAQKALHSKNAAAPKFGQQDRVDDGDVFELSANQSDKAHGKTPNTSHFFENLTAYLGTDVSPLIKNNAKAILQEEPLFLNILQEYTTINTMKANPQYAHLDIEGQYSDEQHLKAIVNYNELIQNGFDSISHIITLDEIDTLLKPVLQFNASDNFEMTTQVINQAENELNKIIGENPELKKAFQSFIAVVNTVDQALNQLIEEAQMEALEPFKTRLQSLVEGNDFQNPLMKVYLSAMASDDLEEAVSAFEMLPNIIGRAKYKPSGGQQAWNELVDIGLNYPNPNIQQATANSLFTLPDEQWIPISQRLLNHGDEHTLILLYNALSMITSDGSFLKNENLKEIVEFGMNYTNPNNELLESQIQTIAIKAIGKLPDVEATSLLENQLSQYDEERIAVIISTLLPDNAMGGDNTVAIRLQEVFANSTKLFDALKSYVIDNKNVPDKRKQILPLLEFVIRQQEINHYKAQHSANGAYL